MAWEYSEKTKQLFLDAVHGKPGTHLGEIENPDGLGEHGSIACGDAMRFTFRVERDPANATQDVIVEARYLTFGCTSAIASSEALCTLIEQPLLRRDGGDVEIIDIKDTLVYCRLTGSCQGCIGASQTLHMLVEQNLKDLVDERIRVIEV